MLLGEGMSSLPPVCHPNDQFSHLPLELSAPSYHLPARITVPKPRRRTKVPKSTEPDPYLGKPAGWHRCYNRFSFPAYSLHGHGRQSDVIQCDHPRRQDLEPRLLFLHVAACEVELSDHCLLPVGGD